jgi:uncharacterized membrane protein
MKNIIRYFIQGLLITVPIGLSLYILAQIIIKVGSILEYFSISLHPIVDPFLGTLLVIISIVIIGMIGSSILVQPLLIIFDKLVDKTPVIKTLYSSVKDFMNAFVGNKKKFNKPVLVTINKENNVQQIGFITQKDLNMLGINDTKVAVYLPNSYAVAGVLLVVPSESVTPLNASSAEVMKFIVSGGVTTVD